MEGGGRRAERDGGEEAKMRPGHACILHDINERTSIASFYGGGRAEDRSDSSPPFFFYFGYPKSICIYLIGIVRKRFGSIYFTLHTPS